MRNLVTLMTILALSASVFAAGTVTITSDGTSGDLVLTYAYAPEAGDGTLAGIAITVAGQAGAQVQGYAGGTDSFFDVFIDEQAAVFTNPLVNTTPLADVNAAGLPGLPADAVSVCVGHLAAASDSTGLATITCDEGTYDLSVDTLRGGAVEYLTDGTVRACTIVMDATVDVIGGGCATCPGDWDGDGVIELGDDLMTFVAVMQAGGFVDIPSTSPSFNACGDYDGDGVMELGDDLMTLVAIMQAGGFVDIACP